MAKFKGKFESAKQDWETPIDLFELLNETYDYNFDLAASKENTKCKNFFTINDDSLNKSWQGLGNCWLNPPYVSSSKNKLVMWIKKAYVETQKDSDLAVSLLIPARTNTKWFLDYCLTRSYAIDFIIGRPKFGGAIHGLPQPLILVTFKQPDSDLENYPKFGHFRI